MLYLFQICQTLLVSQAFDQIRKPTSRLLEVREASGIGHQNCTHSLRNMCNYINAGDVQHEQSLLDMIDAKDAEMRGIQERCHAREQQLDKDSHRMVSTWHT
jgi:hypothetical protein